LNLAFLKLWLTEAVEALFSLIGSDSGAEHTTTLPGLSDPGDVGISRFDDKTRPFRWDFLAIVIIVIMYARDIPRFGRGSWIFWRDQKVRTFPA
jgi:hypothetical protein